MQEEADSCLPTLHEYYRSCRILSGLTNEGRQFKLNNRDIWLYSGAIHYFRVPKPYWRDRLRKLRAAGLNTVDTYIPWNLHEYENGKFDFGDGGSDMQDFLDIKEYLKIIQEEDLFAILRPGPYICAEWDFGGLPSWLLHEDGIKVRTSDCKFMTYVERYFNKLLPILARFQYTNGGPIIAFQIENEYGSTAENMKVDQCYLHELKKIYERNGLTEMYFTSDNGLSPHGTLGSIPGVLRTANFQINPEVELDAIAKTQPDKPLMCMEYWTGWFDHWSEKHHVRTADAFADVLERIITYPASFNLYMFHGGTNWGFMNGANIEDKSTDNKGFLPDTTSYDYDAPLTENGDYTDKYIKVKKLMAKYNKIETKLPKAPKEIVRYKYKNIKITGQLTIRELEEQSSYKIRNSKIMPMEKLPINNNSGQSYGYIVYRCNSLRLPSGSELKIMGRVCDAVMVIVNGVLISKPLTQACDLDGFGYWRLKDSSIVLCKQDLYNATLELVVENWGRNNYGSLQQFEQFKGLGQGPIILNDTVIHNWDIYPLEFKTNWNNSLTGWHPPNTHTGPSLYRGVIEITNLDDTYIDMRQWCKGIVIVNGFVLGRYTEIGPQMTLYLPAPLLRKRANEIFIFEHFRPSEYIQFSQDPMFKGCTSCLPF